MVTAVDQRQEPTRCPIHAWPEFEVQVVVNTDTSSHLLLACLSCDWTARTGWPVRWAALSIAVSRHGMTHIEGARQMHQEER